MLLLLAGLLIWSTVHLVPVALPGVRAGLIERLGANPYKGLFALSVLAGLVLIVLGWRGTVPQPVYTPPDWGVRATIILMLAAIFLFRGAHGASNVKRVLRHPQLSGLVLWSVGHLLSNGDSRSLLLFGGLGLWALVEMPLLNRRDGPWQKPEPVDVQKDVVGIVVTLVMFAILLYLHPYFAGVAPLAAYH